MVTGESTGSQSPQGVCAGPKDVLHVYHASISDSPMRHGIRHPSYADDTQAYDVLVLPTQWLAMSSRIKDFVR